MGNLRYHVHSWISRVRKNNFQINKEIMLEKMNLKWKSGTYVLIIFFFSNYKLCFKRRVLFFFS